MVQPSVLPCVDASLRSVPPSSCTLVQLTSDYSRALPEHTLCHSWSALLPYLAPALSQTDNCIAFYFRPNENLRFAPILSDL